MAEKLSNPRTWKMGPRCVETRRRQVCGYREDGSFITIAELHGSVAEQHRAADLILAAAHGTASVAPATCEECSDREIERDGIAWCSRVGATVPLYLPPRSSCPLRAKPEPPPIETEPVPATCGECIHGVSHIDGTALCENLRTRFSLTLPPPGHCPRRAKPEPLVFTEFDGKVAVLAEADVERIARRVFALLEGNTDDYQS